MNDIRESGVATDMRKLLLILLLCAGAWARSQGQTTACKSNLKNIATALEMYATDHEGRYPERLAQLIPGNYVKCIPTCPTAGYDTYSRSYRALEKPDHFALCCTGSFHAKASLAANYPAYTSEEGLLLRPRDEAADPSACLEQLRRAGDALEAYRRSHGHYPEKLATARGSCGGRAFVYGQFRGRWQLSCPSSHLSQGYAPFQPAWCAGLITRKRLPVSEIPPARWWEDGPMLWQNFTALLVMMGLARLLLVSMVRRAAPLEDLPHRR